MGRDREEKIFERSRVVEIRQRVQKSDEGLLHHVFGARAIAEALFDVPQQSSFVPRDQFTPSDLVADADASDQ
ncbi:MAG: hypothetical protein QM811_21965 [Pirellulales bacterium]